MDERDTYFLMRRKKKISLQEVAAFVGVSFSMIGHYERSERNLSPDKEMKYKEYIENH